MAGATAWAIVVGDCETAETGVTIRACSTTGEGVAAGVEVAAGRPELLPVSAGVTGMALAVADSAGVAADGAGVGDEPLPIVGVIVGFSGSGVAVFTITGVAVLVGIKVAVEVAASASEQMSSNDIRGGGDAWVIEPSPQTQPSTSPSLT